MPILTKIIDFFNPGLNAIAAESWDYIHKETGKRKKGWSPICENKWDKNLCLLAGKKGKCSACGDAKYAILNEASLKANIVSSDAKKRKGVYPLINNDKVSFVAADLDNHDGKKDPDIDVKNFFEFTRNMFPDITPALFSSSSGQGYHIYLFFKEEVEAYKARSIMLEMLSGAKIDISHTRDKSGSFDAIFPKQDAINHLNIGNLIAIPWNGACVQKFGSTLYLNPSTLTPEDPDIEANMEAFIDYTEKISEEDLDYMFETLGCKPLRLRERIIREFTGKNNTNYLETHAAKLLDKCEFLKFCKENVGTDKVSYPDLFHMSEILCQEYGGPQLIHSIMMGLGEKYDPQETNARIIEVISWRKTAISCKTIHAECPGCPGDCGVHNPRQLLEIKNEVDQTELDWISEIQIGVSTKEKAIEAVRRLAAYYLFTEKNDKSLVEERLIAWNTFNPPIAKLTKEEISQALDDEGSKVGIKQFNAVTGIDIVHLTFEIYPSADDENLFCFYLRGQKQPIRMTGTKLIRPNTFRDHMFSCTGEIYDIVTGKGSAAIWQALLVNMLKEKEIVKIPMSQTDAGRLISFINEELHIIKERHSTDTALEDDVDDSKIKDNEFLGFESDPEIHSNTNEFIFVHDEKVYLSINHLMEHTKVDPELKAVKRKEIAKLLEVIGFEYGDRKRRGNRHQRFWEISVKALIEMNN